MGNQYRKKGIRTAIFIENYTLVSQNGSTELIVEMDIAEEFGDYFLKVWPQALEKVKVVAEARIK